MPPNVTALCTTCGLCCSGALFVRAPLKPEEVAWARSKRMLSVLGDGPEPSFGQPCVLLDGTRCAAYEERPAVCRRFECKLLKKVAAGELPLDAARAKVQRVQELFARVGRLEKPTDVQDLLDLGELEALATRDFRDAPTLAPP